MVAMGYQEKRGAANILCVVEQEVFLLVGGEDILRGTLSVGELSFWKRTVRTGTIKELLAVSDCRDSDPSTL